jgi:hypothetical protein
MSPFGKASEKATGSIAQREHAEDYYKKQAAKEKEIDLEPKQVSGKKKGGYVKAADGCCQRGKTRGMMR